MENKRLWIDLSILNLCTVAFLGVALRSKILFSLPMIDYRHLLDAHSHFAFRGWVTLALLALMIYDLLPDSLNKKPVYVYLLTGISLSSWSMLFVFYCQGNSSLANILSTIFIFITYIFGWVFIKDIRKARVNRTVLLLAVSSIICLIISSAGPFGLAYLFASKSRNVIFYHDALYTYLHFQYNGFFTLSVFALLFHRLNSLMPSGEKKYFHRFALLLCISIIPALFLSFLWQDPNKIFLVIAIAGSITVFAAFILFVISGFSLLKIYREISPVTRGIGLLSMIAFSLKMLLQSLIIFAPVGKAVFGDRPMIIGFLHLVFLGFVTLFLLAYFAQKGELNMKNKLTGFAMIIFASAVVVNEIILMGQGLGAIYFKSSILFPWLLWLTAIWLFIGSVLIAIARIKSGKPDLMAG